jgi:V8-like Glu-specific endopeptidase
VELTPWLDGAWDSPQEGRMRWRQRISAPGATSLSFGFDRYRMPPGGRLIVYSPDGQQILSPFNERDNEPREPLWTPHVLGDEAMIEVELPSHETDRLDLRLSAVGRGYRPFSGILESGSCNVDVRCPEADTWRRPVRSVGRYTFVSGGQAFLCTGALINNTARDGKPYFLTANHCVGTAAEAASVVVYWNYENATCRTPGSAASGAPGNGSLAQSQSGAVLRATWAPSDVTLIELDDPVDPALGLHFAGWNRSTKDPMAAAAVHHPQGQEKRISFDLHLIATTSFLGTLPNPAGRFLWVEDWEAGTTEGGSSGAPLFDVGRRIVGHLTGGFAACGNGQSDWFGRFSSGWDGGGTPDSRLRDWLDPLSTSTVQLFGLGADEEIFEDGFESGNLSAWMLSP